MSTSSANSVDFLNPDIYLNHLSPKEAFEYEISRNVLIMLLGATICDAITYIPDDIRVMKRSRFRSVIFCFIFSRLSALAYVLTNVIRRIMPVNNLYAVTLIGIALCATSIGCSSYLFLQRVRAVYADSPRVRRFFFIFWLIYYTLSETLLFFGVEPTYIPGTRSFKDSGVRPVISLAIFITILYDSSIFLAISYKVALGPVIVDRKVGWRATFLSGRGLPRLSRTVLHGGQQYYLLNVLVLIPVGILLCLPSIPQVFKSTSMVFLAPLMASMSCRVYRNTKLFDYDVAPSFPMSEILLS